jgi:hypothetical protein
MLKIAGLDKLQQQLEDAQRAFRALDGEVATVRFNPEEPGSVEAAIRIMEAAIDSKVGPYRNNALVVSIVPKLKNIGQQFSNAQRKRSLAVTSPGPT